MYPNPQEASDLVTFAEEIFDWKLDWKTIISYKQPKLQYNLIIISCKQPKVMIAVFQRHWWSNNPDEAEFC